MLIRLQKLEKLTVECCNSLEEVFAFERLGEDGHAELLPQLSELVLTQLPKFVKMWNKEPAGIAVFQNLRSLQIIRCKSLVNLFSLSTAKNLQHLRTLKIFKCELMEVVITEDEKDKDKIVFRQLKCLVLKHLPKLTCFSSANNNFEWPSLDTVRVKSIPKMETFAPGSQSTPELKTIYVTFLEKFWSGGLNSTIENLSKRTEIHRKEDESNEMRKNIQNDTGMPNLLISTQGGSFNAESSTMKTRREIEEVEDESNETRKNIQNDTGMPNLLISTQGRSFNAESSTMLQKTRGEIEEAEVG